MRIVLSGGGTAGHIYPAVQTGLYLKEYCEAEIYYIGRANSLEEKIAKEHGIPFYPTVSKGLSKKQILSFATKNVKGTAQALTLLNKIKPDYVFTTGGYVSAPVLAAASILRIPYGIHEQNATNGKANRFFSKGAKTIFTSFPTMENRQIFYSGNPVRYTHNLENAGDSLVFFGGSGGAATINEAAYELAVRHPEIPVIVVTGEKRYGTYIATHEIPDNLTVHPYVTDTLSLYEKAKIIISRSGSGALFEIANLGISNILIPFPEAADDHQRKNAQYFEDRGGSIVVEEGLRFFDRLEDEVRQLWGNERLRQAQIRKLSGLSTRTSVSEICKRINKDLNFHFKK